MKQNPEPTAQSGTVSGESVKVWRQESIKFLIPVMGSFLSCQSGLRPVQTYRATGQSKLKSIFPTGENLKLYNKIETALTS